MVKINCELTLVEFNLLARALEIATLNPAYIRVPAERAAIKEILTKLKRSKCDFSQ